MLVLWFHMIFLWLAVILPVTAWRQRTAYRREPGQKLNSRQLYLRVILGQWLAAGGIVFVFWRVGIPLRALGLAPPRLLPLAIVAGTLALALPFWIGSQRRALANPEKVAKIRERFGRVSLLVPMTDEEQRGWVALSITAGVCEEVLYRGFLGFYLGQYLPLAAVAVLASVSFGLSHLYQGPRNALGTVLVGALHWAVYLATGSILPGMVLHALIDIRSGVLLRRAFTEPAPQAA